MNILCVGLANIFHIVAILLIGENLLELTKREGNKIINYCEIIFLSMCNSLPMIKINATFELVFFLLCLYINQLIHVKTLKNSKKVSEEYNEYNGAGQRIKNMMCL